MYPSNATHEVRHQCADEATSDLMRYFKRPLNTQFDILTLLDYFERYTITRKKKNEPVPPSTPPGKWLDLYGNTISARKNHMSAASNLRLPLSVTSFISVSSSTKTQ